MIRINISEARSRLSHYLDSVEKGETVVFCRRNVPVAEIQPLLRASKEPRPVGIDRWMTIPASFFGPLSADVLDSFEGDNGPG